MKVATTIDKQIEILRERKVYIEDEVKARENLIDIGYFRLGFYCFPYEETYPNKKNRSHVCREETSFDSIVKLYYFDVDLRNLLSRYLYRIEINFRAFLIYTVSNKYPNSPIWFVDPIIVESKYAKLFDKKVYTDSFRKNPVIKAHHKKYINDKYAPAWKTIDFMTFGNIITLYQCIKDKTLQLEIARNYGFKSILTFTNYLETLRVIRNECAHNGVLFDISLPKSIMNGPVGKMGANKNNLNGTMSVIVYMLSRISVNRANDLMSQFEAILSSLPIDLRTLVEKCSGC